MMEKLEVGQMTTQDAMQIVLAKYPNAVAYEDWGTWCIRNPAPWRGMVEMQGITERDDFERSRDAWIAATYTVQAEDRTGAKLEGRHGD